MKQKCYSVIIIGMLFLMEMSGQNRIPLWEEVPPYNKSGIIDAEVSDDFRISKVSKPELYHYTASDTSNGLKPAIVIVPGGGYARQAFGHEGIMVAEWFASRGFEAFVLKYRLPDEEIVNNAAFVPLMDGQQAIYLVRSNAEKFGVDPAKIGIIGFSAGGHLAGSVSTFYHRPVNTLLTANDVRPDFSILIYPVVSMDERFTHGGSRQNLLGHQPGNELVALFSLENQVSDTTPVTLLVHAQDDKAVVVANSDLYASNLHDKGVDVTKIILPAGGHGFGFRDSSPVAYWTQYMEVWLNQKLK